MREENPAREEAHRARRRGSFSGLEMYSIRAIPNHYRITVKIFLHEPAVELINNHDRILLADVTRVFVPIPNRVNDALPPRLTKRAINVHEFINDPAHGVGIVGVPHRRYAPYAAFKKCRGPVRDAIMRVQNIRVAINEKCKGSRALGLVKNNGNGHEIAEDGQATQRRVDGFASKRRIE